jgi:hypothetical protein
MHCDGLVLRYTRVRICAHCTRLPYSGQRPPAIMVYSYLLRVEIERRYLGLPVRSSSLLNLSLQSIRWRRMHALKKNIHQGASDMRSLVNAYVENFCKFSVQEKMLKIVVEYQVTMMCGNSHLGMGRMDK